GDQQQRHQPCHEEADGVQQAVVAVQRDGADDAQERGGREVVAGDRDAVLPAGGGAAAVVEVARLRGGAGVADDQQEGDKHEREEDRDVQDRVAELHQCSPSSSSRSAEEIGSSDVFAWRMYSQVMRKVMRNWLRPSTIPRFRLPSTGTDMSPSAYVDSST